MKIGDAIPASVRQSDESSQLLVHFWSISCPACKINMPYLQALRDGYLAHRLQTVAIHKPRGDAELDQAKVRAVADEIGVTETLVFDNDHKISEAFGVDAVPAYFLFDAEGRLRRHALGNFGVRMIGEAVKQLLGEATPPKT